MAQSNPQPAIYIVTGQARRLATVHSLVQLVSEVAKSITTGFRQLVVKRPELCSVGSLLLNKEAVELTGESLQACGVVVSSHGY